MVTLQKSGDSAVKFVFTDSDHYLYGSGQLETPVNSLLLVLDESEMVTFKKLSGDPFLSFRADNSNLGTKAAIEQFYKDNMVGSSGSGSGVTSGDVETMIDAALDDYYDKDEVDAGFSTVNTAIAGKADTSAVTAVANDVSTLSGQVATKVAISDFNAYSAATDSRLAEDEEVTAAALNNLDETKQDALVYYMEDTENETANINIQTDDGLGNTGEYWFNVGGGTNDFGAFSQYDDGEGNVTKSSTQINISSYELIISSDSNDGEDYNTIEVTPTYVTINGEAVATRPYVGDAIDAALSGKADTSAVTAAIDAATSGKVDTSAITTAVTSGSTDAEIPTAKATYDAIQAGGGGGMDDDTQQLISTALNDLNERKADLTELSKYQKKGDYVKTPTLADYMTNDAFDEYATEKERIISGALNDLNDKFGGLRLVKISQTDYDNLATKDENTLYIINNVI